MFLLCADVCIFAADMFKPQAHQYKLNRHMRIWGSIV